MLGVKCSFTGFSYTSHNTRDCYYFESKKQLALVSF